MSELLVQFSTSTAFASKIIRRLTCSRWSHAGFIIGDSELGVSGPDKKLGDPGGVRLRKLPCWDYLYPPIIARVQCTDHVRDRTLDWAKGEIGKPFDDKALYYFLRDRAGLPFAGREWRDPHKWFCSEFIARALEFGGLFGYPLIQPKDYISPNTLLCFLNPFLPADNITEFNP